MTIKQAHIHNKQTTPEPDSLNCNSLYDVLEKDLLRFVWLQSMPILSTHANNFTAGVRKLARAIR